VKKWEHNELAEDLADCKGTGFLDVPHESLIEMVRQDICEGLGLKYNPNAWGSPEWELAKLVREIKEKVEKEGACS